MEQTVVTGQHLQASPQNMVTMLGLNRTSFRVAVASVMAVYVAVGLILPPADHGPRYLTMAILGSIGLAVSLWLAVRGDVDPIGVPQAIGCLLLSVGSANLVWWALPVREISWVRPGAPFVACTIVIALIAVRGRVRWAWAGFALAGLLAVIAVTGWGWSTGIAAQLMVRILVSLIPVTLMVLFVRPLLRFARVLDQREVAAVTEAAAQEATTQQRERQFAALEHDVRPILEKIAAGEELSPDDAENAHLLEHALRDTVRGSGWMSDQVRDAASRARARGVAVRLFDDRTTRCAPSGVGPMREELVRVLAAAEEGAVTARLLPSGRDAAAVIVCQTSAGVSRRSARYSGTGVPVWE